MPRRTQTLSSCSPLLSLVACFSGLSPHGYMMAVQLQAPHALHDFLLGGEAFPRSSPTPSSFPPRSCGLWPGSKGDWGTARMWSLQPAEWVADTAARSGIRAGGQKTTSALAPSGLTRHGPVGPPPDLSGLLPSRTA